MRRYDDPVEVLRAPVPDGAGAPEAPAQFLWQGRLWKVRSVVAHWVETAPWWRSPSVRAVVDAEKGPQVHQEVPTQRSWEELHGELVAERELWRVVAGRPGDPQQGMSSGVFDLALDRAEGCWQLVGCQD
ncbi:hypothetical protein IEQ44_01085 [Nocardioides sp. Y6]|uniref:DUF6504 domain-containing protein n=1 Tax=Nocardioides malaquae TaxID=2773426 RepID=A0ABR9RNV0_9ACTN|nr:DUF6504 family protein [Nocardioides malaquae]MBE7323245.1 hypothetical protein [Nocardioides malaquae]